MFGRWMARKYTAGQLKIIAMISMFVDHAALILLWQFGLMDPQSGGGYFLYMAMRLIGRLAFPLYAFFLVEGFFHTRDRKRYAVRLGLLALISEIPYNLMVNNSLAFPEEQNTLLLLLIGLLVMMGMEMVSGKPGSLVSKCLIFLAGTSASILLKPDYALMGFLLIMIFYQWRSMPEIRLAVGCAVVFVTYGDVFGVACWIAFFFINRYNGEKGRNLGYWPYAFYPVHMLILYGLGVLLHGIYF